MSLYLAAAKGSDSDDFNDQLIDFSLYQIYPRSFKDSDGDGVGDLKGIMSKLDHLIESNVDAFWLSPMYPSPMVDFGYDIQNFTDVDPIYGTMQDFDSLLEAAHEKSLKLFLDLVPNHSSDKHEWFYKSLQNIKPYNDYYVWHKGRVLKNGTIVAPNNWVSVFGGPAWTWRDERQAYYFHQFTKEQPDLNYNNQKLVREMKEVIRFWLRKGVDGFRVDAVNHLCEDTRYLDEPLTGDTNDPNNYGYTEKIYSKDQLQTYKIVLGWRQVMEEFEQPRFMMMEAYTNVSMTMRYYAYGAHYPFNFGLITDMQKNSTAADFKNMVDSWMSNMPAGSIPNWVAGNHDKPRLATRFGPKRARAVTLISLLLPGVSVTYNGEEIGMEDTWISWEDTVDPSGCNAGKDGYESASRDPARTPFQWDDSTSAGFSTNPKTWLRVNDNYRTVNLAAEKEDSQSYYNFYKKVSSLKKSNNFKGGKLVTKLLNKNVFAFARDSRSTGYYVVINFGDKDEIVDLSVFDNISRQSLLYYDIGAVLPSR
ncbi:Alpha-glucosidase [Habropoda laboriosa]|uniref:alpha-glucosidase n=1 Tax=Habropoda laboriosa TaxID=597456 RepID=A0A0L7RFW7_9HYME|nr:Alpha-glucosidase [Habropoda laboriosa]